MPPRRKLKSIDSKSQKDQKQRSIDAFFMTPSKKPRISNPTEESETSSSSLIKSKPNSNSINKSEKSKSINVEETPSTLLDTGTTSSSNTSGRINSSPTDHEESFASSIFDPPVRRSTTSCPTSIDENELDENGFFLSPSPSPGPSSLSLEYNPTYGLHSSWLEALKRSFVGIGLTHLHQKLSHSDYAKGIVPFREPSMIIHPPFDSLYNWSHLTPLDQVKVVILGIEPSKIKHFSHGLAYSQSFKQKRILGSTSNIHAELIHEFPDESFHPTHGSLVSWAKSGVLLLNIIQTTTRSSESSHRGIGWERFTDAVLDAVNRSGGRSIENAEVDHQTNHPTKGLVFLVWGEMAAKRINDSLIPSSNRNHLILKTSNPQPSTAHLGFLGSNHFRLTNEFLEKTYGSKATIEWCKLEPMDPIDESLNRKSKVVVDLTI